MKYKYIVSIFLLIFVIIISQAIYVDTNKKIIEGWWGSWGRGRTYNKNNFSNNFAAIKNSIRIAAEKARLAAQNARARYLAFVATFVNDRQTPYVNLLGQAYVENATPENLKAYQEASEIDALANQTTPCNSDKDIAKIFNLTSQILTGGGQNSTKVYFISEVILKGLGHFYVYNINNNETQFNYLSVQFPKTFKDDNSIKKKYYKFITLLALSHISKSTTSTSLPPVTNYFLKISEPIITECKTIINDLIKITYDLSIQENAEIQKKYKTIVK